MDKWEKHYVGRRSGGRTCACCKEPAPRRCHGAVRARLAEETRKEVAEQVDDADTGATYWWDLYPDQKDR